MKLNNRIFLTFTPIFMLLLFGSIISYISFLGFRNEQRLLYRDNLTMNQLVRYYDKMRKSFVHYLEFKRFEDLDAYLRESALLKENMISLSSLLKGDGASLVLDDILGLMESYLEVSDSAVILKRNRMVEEYYGKYLESLEISGYIDIFIGRYNNILLQRNAGRYQDLEDRANGILRFYLILFIALIIFSLWLMAFLSRLISRPVVELTARAGRIAVGDYKREVDRKYGTDELQNLSASFTVMEEKIRENIQLLEDKLSLQKSLLQEEAESSRVREEAVQVEFSALQSQINPHFIFNTLNACVQLAMFEEAVRTERFLNSFSELLRYSFRDLHKPVTLKEEFDHIEVYLSLMKVRYGEIFSCEFYLDCFPETWFVPRTILQPIIENAFVHVLQSVDFLELIIDAREIDGNLVLQFHDNGPGFPEGVRHEINGFTALSFDELVRSSRSRIGLINVYFRLRILLGEQVKLSVIEEGRGGCLSIVLPRRG